MFEVKLSRQVLKDLKALNKAGQRGVVDNFLVSVKAIRENPYRPRPGVDIKLLRGQKGLTFRLRIGNYRALYQVYSEDKIVRFTGIVKHHKGY